MLRFLYMSSIFREKNIMNWSRMPRSRTRSTRRMPKKWNHALLSQRFWTRLCRIEISTSSSPINNFIWWKRTPNVLTTNTNWFRNRRPWCNVDPSLTACPTMSLRLCQRDTVSQLMIDCIKRASRTSETRISSRLLHHARAHRDNQKIIVVRTLRKPSIS